MANDFWANPALEPKRTNRFLIYMEEPFYTWIAKSVARPSYQMADVSHTWLNHTFNYPGRITWQPIEVVIVDPGSENGNFSSTMGLYEKLLSAGYVFPENENQTSSISKLGATTALGQVRIQELNAAGDPTEQFTVYNSFISTVQLGNLTYENEEIVSLTMTIKYDYATFELVPA